MLKEVFSGWELFQTLLQSGIFLSKINALVLENGL
jgi:hypothetical protein